MSKTVRRKNATHEYAWVLRDWEWFGYHLTVRIQIDPYSKEGRRKLAKFHSDHASIMDSMGSKTFRVITTHRPDRRAARADLHRWITDGMDPDGDWNQRMSRTYRHSVFFEYWD